MNSEKSSLILRIFQEVICEVGGSQSIKSMEARFALALSGFAVLRNLSRRNGDGRM
jgi:hypothetical protein